MTPFIKWVGGKRWLLPQLRAFVFAAVGQREGITLHEPFLGGGALFWDLAGGGHLAHAHLSDANTRLIRAYRGIAEDPLRVRSLLGVLADEHKRDPEGTWARVSRQPLTPETSDPECAAWLIYVSRCGFNGLYRTNSVGQYNVALGRSADGTPNQLRLDDLWPSLAERQKLLTQHATLSVKVFGQAQVSLLGGAPSVSLSVPKPGDVVFDDPPYLGTYSGYHASGFGHAKHLQLELYLRELAESGVHVIACNSDTPKVREIYQLGAFWTPSSPWRGFHVHRPGTVSAGSDRSRVAELLIVPASQDLPRFARKGPAGAVSDLDGRVSA